MVWLHNGGLHKPPSRLAARQGEGAGYLAPVVIILYFFKAHCEHFSTTPIPIGELKINFYNHNSQGKQIVEVVANLFDPGASWLAAVDLGLARQKEMCESSARTIWKFIRRARWFPVPVGVFALAVGHGPGSILVGFAQAPRHLKSISPACLFFVQATENPSRRPSPASLPKLPWAIENVGYGGMLEVFLAT